MSSPFEVINMPSVDQFVADYVAPNRPVVVQGLEFDAARWTPEAVTQHLGDLTTLVYGALFDLEDIQSLGDYVDDWFGQTEIDEPDVPYVRWYNQLRDVDFAWGDEAFTRMHGAWSAPACLPKHDLLVPVSGAGVDTNPVTGAFPYRSLQVAAKGARTRLHRDPFCSDAVVCQFSGVKEAVMYSPERAGELTNSADGTSFGGFVDVRDGHVHEPSVDPDFRGEISSGDMIYVPHGWLHDVLVVEDSLSVTWNFVHRAGANEFMAYLDDSPEEDSEFEILQYFHQLAGLGRLSAADIQNRHFATSSAS